MNDIRKIMEVSIFPFIKMISNIVPTKKNVIVFGAWFGKGYSDNSKYLLEYMLAEKKCLNLVCVLNKDEYGKLKDYNNGIKFLRKESLKAYFYIMIAKVNIMTHGYSDLGKFYFLGKGMRVQLWHGVAFKKIGFDGQNTKTEGWLDKIYKYWFLDDIYIAPSKEYKSKLKEAFSLENKKILEVGQPRNRKMYDKHWLIEKKIMLIKEINSSYTATYNQSCIVVTYMPTFRDLNSEVFSFTNLNARVIEEIKNSNPDKEVIIIEKSHFINANKANNSSNIYTVKECDTQELLAATDILITDYSSCFFDYLILDRPIVQFVYDYNYYKNDDRGLYYSIEEVQCGPVVYTEEEMIKALKDTISGQDDYLEYRERVRNRFIEFEDEKSCEKITNYIMNKLNI